MYHASKIAAQRWAGEPEIDPIVDGDIPPTDVGVETTPEECIELGYRGVLGENLVEGG